MEADSAAPSHLTPPRSGIKDRRDYLISDLLKAAAAGNTEPVC